MKQSIMVIMVIFTATLNSALAAKLADSKYFDYKIFFTNPECETYLYAEPIQNGLGDYVTQRPQNAFCKDSDRLANEAREESPNFQLKKLINDSSVSRIFLTYLSFSDEGVAQTLCENIVKRNLDVTFIIDSNNEGRERSIRMWNYVKECRPGNEFSSPNTPNMQLRGNTRGLGYAHNKVILAEYKAQPEKVTIVFGSGNMSAGTVLHHENWHFITTSKKTHFAKSHFCLKEGMLNHASSKKEYSDFILGCKEQIEVAKEEDIQTYFVPGEGEEAFLQLSQSIQNSNTIQGAAHRFTLNSLRDLLVSAKASGAQVEMLFDDDVYWTGMLRQQVGSNMLTEFYKVRDLQQGGVDVYFLETNQNAHLIHHNKFFVFSGDKPGVFTGAGNFTKAAFSSNMENFYWITIPSVVEAYKSQYKYLTKDIGTPYMGMPNELVIP